MNPLSSLLPWAGMPGSPQKTATKIKKRGKNEVTYLLFIYNLSGHSSMTQLTKALGFLSAPVTAALAC